MLKRVGHGVDMDCSGAVVPIKDAHFPAPFASRLEFNSPAHGTWNIVHMGMLVPDAQQIYVCAANCMRGVVLTAAEMNAAERFSFVLLEENDLLEGTVEDVTIEGVADVLRKLPKLPSAVLLFTVCTHHFLGCDLDRIYRALEAQFPSLPFVRCFMDPIMQKQGLTPDQKLRKSMLDLLPACPAQPNRLSIVGADFPLADSCALLTLPREAGYTVHQLPQCNSFAAYQRLSTAQCLICTYPAGLHGTTQAAKRLGRQLLYLPSSFDYDEISTQLSTLCHTLRIATPDFSPLIARCERTLADAKSVIGNAPISIDATVHPRPLGLAKLLLQHGFTVKCIYLDAISGEESPAFAWLQQNAPDLMLKATVQHKMRVLPRGNSTKVLAIGQKAAWFENTPYFVNLVQGGELWGFDGVCRMAQHMIDAFSTPKDTKDLIPRKGLVCESCI